MENQTNRFGYEISASGLRYHIRLVARVCLLAMSAHKSTKFDRNRKQMYEKHDFRPEIHIIPIIWRSAAEAAAFKLAGGHQQVDGDGHRVGDAWAQPRT